MTVINIDKKIEQLRKKLNESIEKNGIDSEETLHVSQELDDVISEYLKNKK